MQYLILNFKTYPEATADKAVELAQIVNNASQSTKVHLVVCPQTADIFRVREEFPRLSIWSQHIDPINPGRSTGWTSPTSVVMAGASGSLINHSEHPLTLPLIENTVRTCKQYHLSTCVAVKDTPQSLQVREFHPDFLAYEPPELVSGDVSLVDVDVDAAAEFVKENIRSGSHLILGAGVKDATDITTALSLGYQGVLVASGFVKAQAPDKFLAELLNSFTP